MYNELIDALRTCADHNAVGDKCYGECPYNGNYNECVDQMILDAADALEAAEQRIAELEARLPKEGEWIRKEVKVYCPRDCWNPSACAIEGTWNEEEGWNLEMQDGFCSVCGEQDDQYYKDKYCPNCGARMDGKEQTDGEEKD